MGILCWLFSAWIASCTPVAPVTPVTPTSPAAPQPVTVPAVTVTTITPAGIPQAAVKFRRTLIQSWQQYFALGQPSAIGFGQIHQESRWQENATSPVGAAGLAQFMPGTAEWVQQLLPADQAALCHDTHGCPRDPRWAINAMSRFDWWLWGQNVKSASDQERWGKSLAGYNAGSGWVTRESAKAPDPTRWFDSTENVCLRTPANCAETKAYVRAIWNKWRPLYLTWG